MTGVRGRIVGLVCFIALSLASGCDSKSARPPAATPAPDYPTISVAIPEQMVNNTPAEWVVSWSGGLPPYTLKMEMGGGTTENEIKQEGALSPFSYSFTMVNPSRTVDETYAYMIVLEDASGDPHVTTTDGFYTVAPLNRDPKIHGAASYFDTLTRTLLVTASDPDKDQLTCQLSLPPGLLDAGGSHTNVAKGIWTFSYHLQCANPAVGQNCAVQAAVEDPYGGLAAAQLAVSIPPQAGEQEQPEDPGTETEEEDPIIITGNHPPEIDASATSYDQDTRILTVKASDPDGDELHCAVSEPYGLAADAVEKEMGLSGTVMFNWSADNLFTDRSGITTITVDDRRGGTDTLAVGVVVPGTALPVDTLIATPLVDSVPVDTPVTIVVATGVPASPFQYLNGVGITIDSDAEYVAESFNVGEPGGGVGDVDGIWGEMNPAGGFLLPPENFIQAKAVSSDRERWDFNLTPVSGSALTEAAGALFCFKFQFSTPGVKTLGFEQGSGKISRTYYSHGVGINHLWSDINNDGSVVRNSIIVE